MLPQRNLEMNSKSIIIQPQRDLKKGWELTLIKTPENVNAYEHHLTHPINLMIQDYNEFSRLTFKVMAPKG